MLQIVLTEHAQLLDGTAHALAESSSRMLQRLASVMQ